MSITKWKSNFYALVWLIIGAWQFTWRNKAVILLGGLSNIYLYVPQLLSSLNRFGLLGSLALEPWFSTLLFFGLTLFVSIFGIWGEVAIIRYTLQKSKPVSKQTDGTFSDKNSLFQIARQMLLEANSYMPRVLKFLFFVTLGSLVLSLLPSIFGGILAPINTTAYTIFTLIRFPLLVLIVLVYLLYWNLGMVVQIAEELDPIPAIRRGGQIILTNPGRLALVVVLIAIVYLFGYIVLRSISFTFLGFMDQDVFDNLSIIWKTISFIWFSIFSGFTNVLWVHFFLRLIYSPKEDVTLEKALPSD
ncbi:MAG: hypothetical protein HND51_16255 [Chloroflexi bacterium]|nr:hypothetical protein [Chloroflexota bacterium]NOH13193.1 hypothetical protein [Chloroflexota bacterium]